MQPEEFKKKVRSILSQEYAIDFLGKNFNKIVLQLTTTKAEKIYAWINQVILNAKQPILIGSNKTYKEWKVCELLTFRYAFTIRTEAYRILLVKVKNSFYIEFHLGNHKYYDRVRKELFLKKNS